MNFYDNVREICRNNGTSVTVMLKTLGRSTGSTGSWKAGVLPTANLLIEMADYLHVSLDELVYGREHLEQWFPPQEEPLTKNQKEWLDIISLIPEEKQEMCKDFLRTHIVEPDTAAIEVKGA